MSSNELDAALLACPYCGGPARLDASPANTKAPLWFRVRCQDYHCGGTTWAMVGPEAAVKAWNRRDGKA
ncbi:MAG: hypothetical protein IH616_02230 [Gemmatimonadales bacterium]|nr:hypothetical protein [Gemmatimonadales bacterium]